MRSYQITDLYESRGFSARKAGDEYVDPTNREDVATFQGLTLLPNDSIAYESYDEMIAAFDEWESGAEGTVYRINDPNNNRVKAVIRSVMIVNMNTPRGPEHYALFMKDLGKLEGKLINIPAGVITGHGGYVMNRDVSHSERAGLKPADVITSDKPVSIRSVSSLLEPARQTAGDEPVDQMQEYLDALAKGRGTDYVIADGAQYAKLHQKYLGEWASPIALITGQIEPRSQVKEIEKEMLNGDSIKQARVVYNNNVSETLFDSVVMLGTNEIFISTKAKTGGAAASLKGLYNVMNENLLAEAVGKFDRKFWKDPKTQRFKKIVDTIIENSAVDGLLRVALTEDIIDNVDLSRIESGLSGERYKKSSFKPTRRLTNYMAEYAANTNHPGYSPTKHAIAAIARQVTDKLNDEDYTEIVRVLLNHASIVQIYFKAVIKGNDLVCKGFDLVWPAVFEGKIHFFAGKSYSATEIKGKVGFKIGKGADIVDDPDESLKVKIDDKERARAARAREKAADAAVGKITKKGERDVRNTAVKDVVALGRTKKAG